MNLLEIKHKLKTGQTIWRGDTVKQLVAALEAKDAGLQTAERRITEMSNNDSWAVDEFNAGYQAFEQRMDLDDAEATYRSVLPAEVPSFDNFSTGYAWAKFVSERMATK